MGWPQTGYIALVAASIGIAVVKHGEPHKHWNAWDNILGAAISVGLLCAGGIFG
jgi:hypothetical protein